jgi:HD-GYP domain-containing protein (c-di-GMP phosphodiesterase class II)
MKIVKIKINTSKAYTQFDFNTLKVGDKTLFDIYIKRDENFIIIIEAGTLISDKLYAKIKNQTELYILKKDEENQILSCESLKYYIRHNRDDLQKRVSLLYEISEQLFDIFAAGNKNIIHLECVELIIESILFLVKYDENFLKNTMPYFENDHVLYSHSLHVSVYTLFLGNLLKFNDEDLLKLGVAALLHDVGLKKIDETVIQKESQLSEEELNLIHKHSLYGVEIMQHNKIHDPYILNAVMHHHERYDGSGYPNQLTGDDISNFAAIIAICDVFDALTNNRPHRKNLSSFNALKMMMRDPEMANKFNQKYLNIFLKSFL